MPGVPEKPLRVSVDQSENPSPKIMSEERKEKNMMIVEQELRRIQALCLKAGYSARQVERWAGCFFRASAKAKREARAKTGLAFMAVVCLIFVILQFGYPYRCAVALSRAGMIKLLGVWDWRHVYSSRCLLDNPLYLSPDRLTRDDCQICEGVQGIQHVQHIDPSEVLEKFFKRDLPLIVDDGLQGWADSVRAYVKTPRDVAQLYERDPVLRSRGGCGFSSNVRLKHGGHRALLHDVMADNITAYFAHWENCQSSAAKAFRSAYRRPSLLSVAVETASTNWVFVSRNYTAAIFKQVDTGHPLTVLLQTSGQVEVKVQPWSPCDQLCPVLRDTLKAGQVLAVTDFLWKVSYLPSPEQENVGVGFGASF